MSDQSISLNTYGALKAAGFELYVGCRKCGPKNPLRECLDELIDRYGADYCFIGKKYRCSICGERTTGVLSKGY